MPQRPTISAITLHLVMPDGSTRVHTLDPRQSDALVWSDRAVEVMGGFYASGGPAHGKRMTRKDLEHAFGKQAAEAVIPKGQDDVEMTPEVVTSLWNSPKDAGHMPAFLAKSLINQTNG